MQILSNSFPDGGVIPAKFAMKAIPGGSNVSPQARIIGVPPSAQSLAISFVDRHPMARRWVHWLVVNIIPGEIEIPEGASPSRMPAGCLELINTFGFKGYGGPQPPRGSGVHHYELAAYALSEALKIGEKETSEADFLELVRNKVLAKSTITGGFESR